MARRRGGGGGHLATVAGDSRHGGAQQREGQGLMPGAAAGEVLHCSGLGCNDRSHGARALLHQPRLHLRPVVQNSALLPTRSLGAACRDGARSDHVGSGCT